ncbi:hypothetical protein PRNP1_003031 [Phytophthora ramorum]
MPLYTGTDGALYAASSGDECSSYLGRACVANTLVDSGSFTSRNGETALKTIKSYSTFVDYTPDTQTSSSQQQQQSTQASGSQQQTSQTNGSEQQQTSQTSGSKQQSSDSRKLAVQTSDLEKEWEQTNSNFGVGKLD